MNTEERSNDPGDRSSDKSWIDKIFDIFSSTPKTREDVNELLQVATANQLIGRDEFSIIAGAMEVTESHARDVMVPRTQMIVVKASDTLEEFLHTVIDSGHSRFPVVADTADDIIGILHAKDLLPLILDKNRDTFNMADYLREPFKVPESMRLNTLLRSFRENRNHMAIVIDEYGGVAGLITIEDILEEIVGDIEDEFDVAQDTPVRSIGDNDYIVKGQMEIEEFNAQFDTDFDDSDVDTIAGLVTQHAGHLPQSGESLSIGDLQFKVVYADNRRVHLLRVQELQDNNNAS
ncbi:Magnesium and cobalt efflux protein CorC [BD1-7 clade bacterium]|uniref:Magnesium and cobalt efflux protein CorC n=1 Tax=BD1-7 clade bacterium TaxID=2029982 RepID=A0A5S9QXB3_9GAMM|nr:Magnesium and cobalt efflux protein CorC [BD1-7 clade bacterium]